MKNLKKILIVVIVLANSTKSYTQTFGVRAGLNLSTMVIKDHDQTYSDDFKLHPGFHVGATTEFPITEAFSFETGLFLSTKGLRQTQADAPLMETIATKVKMNLYYLDIPLTAKATFDVKSTKIYGVLGPYFGWGLYGKFKTEVTESGETQTIEGEVNWGSNDDDLKRLDFGFTVGTGVEINSIHMGVSYNLGMANISNYPDEGLKYNNRVLSISIGYRFGSK